jgi:hypothetical protein
MQCLSDSVIIHHDNESDDVFLIFYRHPVGGGTTRCLQTDEAGGLGEGWSDALANWFNQNSSAVHDFRFGGPYSGPMRRYIYSVNATTNSLKYSAGGIPNSGPYRTFLLKPN